MRIVKGLGIIFGILILYICFWPVEIDPVAWEPMADQGLIGDFSPNSVLSAAEVFGIGDGIGRDVVDLERLETRWTP